MSIQKPASCDEIAEAIGYGRPFTGTKFSAAHIYVLSGPQSVTGPLAEAVNRTARDYEEQYLTGGGRERAAWHVVYYVTRNADRRVLAVVLANGEMLTDETIAEGRANMHPERVPAKAAAAIREGLRNLKTARRWESIATDRGDYPTQPDGHVDGEGMTFTLWGRDARTAIQQAQALAHFTDRAEAHAARIEYEKGGEPYTSPTGYQGTKNHAWVTRSAAEDAPALGTTHAEHKERNR